MPSAAHLPASLTDALARLGQDRDPDAWAWLVDQVRDELLRYARAIVGDDALAEDIVQNALLAIAVRAGTFAPAYADSDHAARRWMLRVCARQALQALRSSRRATRRERHYAAHGEAGGADHATPDARTLARERSTLVRQALASLPEQTRLPVLLHHVSGLTYEDVARELQLPVGTAKTRVRRGLDQLRMRLVRDGLSLSLALLPSALRSAGWSGAALGARRSLAPGAVNPALRGALRWRPHLLNAPAVLAIASCIALMAAALAVHWPRVARAAAPSVERLGARAPSIADNADADRVSGSAALNAFAYHPPLRHQAAPRPAAAGGATATSDPTAVAPRQYLTQVVIRFGK